MALPACAAERRAAAPLLLGAGARRCRSICPARTALSSKPAARRCCGRMTGKTGVRMDTDRFIDPAPHTMPTNKQKVSAIANGPARQNRAVDRA